MVLFDCDFGLNGRKMIFIKNVEGEFAAFIKIFRSRVRKISSKSAVQTNFFIRRIKYRKHSYIFS